MKVKDKFDIGLFISFFISERLTDGICVSIYTRIRQPKLPHVSLVNYSFVVVVVIISFFSSVLFWVVFIVMCTGS